MIRAIVLKISIGGLPPKCKELRRMQQTPMTFSQSSLSLASLLSGFIQAGVPRREDSKRRNSRSPVFVGVGEVIITEVQLECRVP